MTVSILTHPKRWVLRTIVAHNPLWRARFNPHPPEKVGATWWWVPLSFS